MKNYILSLTIILSLLIGFPVLANGTSTDYSSYSADTRVYSFGNYLTSDEIASYNSKLLDLEDAYNTTVAFIITDDYKGNVDSLSDSIFFDSNLNPKHSGILAVIDMNERIVDISTYGDSIKLIDQNDIDYLLDEITVGLGENNYEMALNDFTLSVEKTLSGTSSSFFDLSELLRNLAVAFVISIAITYFMLASQKAKHRIPSSIRNANNYVTDDSIKMITTRDQFIRTHTTKTPRSNNNNNSRGGGGGRSSGGGSRRF